MKSICLERIKHFRALRFAQSQNLKISGQTARTISRSFADEYRKIERHEASATGLSIDQPGSIMARLLRGAK